MHMDWRDIEEMEPNVIWITSKCNQKCIFCAGSAKKEPGIDKIKKRIDQADKEVYFQGGEPTLNKSLPKLIRYARNQNKNVFLVTNGLMFAYKKYAEVLFNAGLTNILFAFHASNEKLNNFLSRNEASFKSKCAALKNIAEYWKPNKVRLIFIINKYNKNDILNFTRFIGKNFKGIKVIEFKLIRWLGVDSNKKLFPKIEDFVEELNNAFAYGKENGINILTNGIPLCYLGSNIECSYEYQRKEKGKRDFMDRVFIKKCESCSLRGKGGGFRSDYAKIIKIK